MTTKIVQSISDEQLVEIEQAAIDIKGWNLVDAFRNDDPDEGEVDGGEWCVGRIDEDGNQYPVMEVNAHQYDSQDSELLAHYYGLCSRDSILGLIARLRAAEVDAKRYRWLRDHGRQPIAVRNHVSHLYHGALDGAIDAAMERKP